MTNFVKFSNKYVPTILTLDLPWSCAIKDYSSRRESILSLYKPCKTLTLQAKLPAGRPRWKKCQNDAQRLHFSSNVVSCRNPWRRAFSGCRIFLDLSFCMNVGGPRVLISDDSQLDPREIARDIKDFVKFSKKYVTSISTQDFPGLL